MLEEGTLIKSNSSYEIYMNNIDFDIFPSNTMGRIRFAMTEIDKKYNLKNFFVERNKNRVYIVTFTTLEIEEEINIIQFFQKIKNNADMAGVDLAFKYAKELFSEPEDPGYWWENIDEIFSTGFDNIKTLIILLIILILSDTIRDIFT